MGYFRFFYYIAYIFNTICRIFKRHGKQILWVLCIFAFLLLCIYPSKSHAYYLGDDTYTDPNYTIYKAYENISLDFLRRFDIISRNSSYDNITGALRDFIVNQNRDIYIYYTPAGVGNNFGESMLNGAPLNNSVLWILVMQKSSTGFSISPSSYSNYLGLECDILNCVRTGSDTNTLLFRIDNSVTVIERNYIYNGNTVYIPYPLLHYMSSYVYEYFINNKSLEEIEQLYEINNKLDTIIDDDVSTETENETQDVLEDSQDVFNNQYTSDYNGYNSSFLNTILSPIATLYDGTTVRKITFTLPFVNTTFQFRGDAISSHIRNTDIYIYVQLFWWVIFSIPIFILLRRIVLWLGTGEFINKPSKFALYMSDFISKNITPGMM